MHDYPKNDLVPLFDQADVNLQHRAQQKAAKSATSPAAMSGHEDVSGIQKYSRGELYPWSVYTIEFYLPVDKAPDKSANERFMFAEIWAKQPDDPKGQLVGEYFRDGTNGYPSDEVVIEAHKVAERKALRCKRIWKILNQMHQIMSYGHPNLSDGQIADRVASVVRVAGDAIIPVDQPPDARELTESKDVDFYGG